MQNAVLTRAKHSANSCKTQSKMMQNAEQNDAKRSSKCSI